MKEVIKEKVQKYTMYEAIDGTEFSTKTECEKYEESAKGVVRARISKLIVGKENAWTLIAGDGVNEVVGIKMQTGRDLEYIKQFLLMECPYYDNGTGLHTKRRDEIFDIMEKAYDSDDIVLFGINIDGDYYWINSRQNIIDNLMNLGKVDEKA